jgi:cytochrome c oxidase subunit I+III
VTVTTTPTPARTEESEAFTRLWSSSGGLRGFLLNVQHKDVGLRYMVTAFAFFLVGGIEALVMRLQLSRPENDLIDADTYNQLFTMHGSTMMFLFAVPFLEGLASYLIPLMIGARDLAFPRYNAFNYWCYLLGGVILYSSFLFALVPSTGWFSYVPLSGPEFADKAMDFWLMGMTLAEISAVGAAVEIAVTVLTQRAPGMTLSRMPIMAWTMLAVAFLIIVAFTPLIVASLLLELDRTAGTAFFDSSAGGSPLLWQHLFWIFGHPEVYVMFLPGAAIISHVIPVHARHALVAYPLVVVALAATAVMSLGLWVHHMYTTGLPPLTTSFFTAASMSITLASGLQVFAWLMTLWFGSVRFTVPMLYALGFIITFVAGGITGVMVASVAFDEQVHDSYFVVAHFHYVLIGGMLFPVFAALHHWWGKFTGRVYRTGPAVAAFWLVFGGFHLTFFPMHLSGLWGMPRRVYTYDSGLGVGWLNLLSTVGAFALAIGVVVMVVNLTASFRRPDRADGDPWGGDSLEWRTSSPPHPANWRRIPLVVSRSPSWDPPDASDEDQRRPIAEAFDHRPTDLRATPLSTVITAEPRAAILIPGPTFWPLVAPVGLAVVAVSVLVSWWPLAVIGLVIVLVGFGGWAWSNESGERHRGLPALAGRYPFEASGPRAIGWWGVASWVIVGIVAMATLAFSALFLQVNAPVWPFEALVGRPWTSAAVVVLLALAWGVTAWGARSGRYRSPEDEGRSDPAVRARQLWSAGIALIAGVFAIAGEIWVWGWSRLDPSADAYQSVAWTVVAAAAVIALGALALGTVAVLGRIRHRRDTRGSILLEYASLAWLGALVCWLLAWATTDLFPVLVI